MVQKFRLELREINVAELTRHVDRVKALGFGFSTLAELEWLPIYRLHQECRKRQPPVETHKEPQDVVRWKAIWFEDPDLYHVLLAAENPVAVCGLHRTETPGEFECGFTGVLSDFAGRGLSTALKSSALLAARAREIVCVTTKTHPENAAMKALNSRLRFIEDEGRSRPMNP